jgi:hypothetical protein
VRIFATVPFVARHFAPNPALTRALVVPGQDAAHPWFVTVGINSLCLISGGVGTCNSEAHALAGNLWLQLIKPFGNSPDSPLPPAGTPTPSTIVGLAPEGTVGVMATTKAGETPAAALANGMFSITATDITGLQFQRRPIAVPIKTPSR